MDEEAKNFGGQKLRLGLLPRRQPLTSPQIRNRVERRPISARPKCWISYIVNTGYNNTRIQVTPSFLLVFM